MKAAQQVEIPQDVFPVREHLKASLPELERALLHGSKPSAGLVLDFSGVRSIPGEVLLGLAAACRWLDWNARRAKVTGASRAVSDTLWMAGFDRWADLPE